MVHVDRAGQVELYSNCRIHSLTNLADDRLFLLCSQNIAQVFNFNNGGSQLATALVNVNSIWALPDDTCPNTSK